MQGTCPRNSRWNLSSGLRFRRQLQPHWQTSHCYSKEAVAVHHLESSISCTFECLFGLMMSHVSCHLGFWESAESGVIDLQKDPALMGWNMFFNQILLRWQIALFIPAFVSQATAFHVPTAVPKPLEEPFHCSVSVAWSTW